VGGILLVCGLYCVLWGKTMEIRIVEFGDNTIGGAQDGQEENNHQQKVLDI
jgi:hypothetical protein